MARLLYDQEHPRNLRVLIATIVIVEAANFQFLAVIAMTENQSSLFAESVVVFNLAQM